MFNKNQKIGKSLDEAGLSTFVKSHYKRFEVLYKLRSEYISRLEKQLLKAVSKKPKKTRSKYSLIPTKGQSQEIIEIIKLRNDIAKNKSSLENRLNVEAIIETFDRTLYSILNIDKKLVESQSMLGDVKGQFKTSVSTTYSPNSVEQVAELSLKGNDPAVEIFGSFLKSKRFLKQIDKYVEDNTLELQETVVKALNSKSGNTKRDAKGRFKSKSPIPKLRKSLIVTSQKFVDKIRPRTIELVGVDNLPDGLPDFFSIVEVLNARLTPVIISNMGNDSLVNRTGRFASSSRVTRIDIRDDKAIFSYTYRERPYSIFEQDNGKVPWNSNPSRDPRGIIEKSIRQLAKEAGLEKFGLAPIFKREF